MLILDEPVDVGEDGHWAGSSWETLHLLDDTVPQLCWQLSCHLCVPAHRTLQVLQYLSQKYVIPRNKITQMSARLIFCKCCSYKKIESNLF